MYIWRFCVDKTDNEITFKLFNVLSIIATFFFFPFPGLIDLSKVFDE